MKKLMVVVFLVMLLVWGCLYNFSPVSSAVEIDAGEAVVFSVDLFPTTSSLLWFLDGVQVGTDMLSFTYAPDTGDIGTHKLVVQEFNPNGLNIGTQYHQWVIEVLEAE